MSKQIIAAAICVVIAAFVFVRLALPKHQQGIGGRKVATSSVPASEVLGSKQTSTVETQSPSSEQLPNPATDWKILRVGEYKFQVSYPKNWMSARNVSDASNPSPALGTWFLVSGRGSGEETQTVIVVMISAYNKPRTSLEEWLDASYRTNLAAVKQGGINEALDRAYAGENGFVSSQTSQNGQTVYYEFGTAGGILVYATYVQTSASPFVYLIEIHLPLEKDTKSDPSDHTFMEQYEQIVSSFEILD